MIQWYYNYSMTEEQRYEHRLQELKKKEDFVVTVLQRTGERFFDQKHIQALKARQREIFKGVPYASQAALDNMLDKVMKKLREKHDEQIQQLKNARPNILQSLPIVSQESQKGSNKPKGFNDNKIQQKYYYKQTSDQDLRQLYMDHIIEVINHINSKYHHKTFLMPYQVTDKGKGSERRLKLRAFKADSDFVYMKQFNEQHLITKLTREQIIIWMWSFAHMIAEMENIGVYHIDLEIRNTVKLHKIFRCIDFEYSFLLNQKTKDKVFQLLKRADKSMPFGLIQIDENLKQCKQFYAKSNTICEKLDKLKKSKTSYSTISFYEFEQRLKLNHKVRFLFILSKAIVYSRQKLENDVATIISIIQGLDLEGNHVYYKFIQSLEDKYKQILENIEVKPLKYLKEIKDNELRRIFKEKFYNFVNIISKTNRESKEYAHYHTYVMPIETFPTHQSQLDSECKVAKTCQYIADAQSFWKLKKPRYLYYLFKMLDQFSKSRIYFTHLSISDFVKQGEMFKIWTLENALILTSSQQIDRDSTIKSRQFVQKFVETTSLHDSEAIALKALAKTAWFGKIKQTNKNLDDKDFKQLQEQLKILRQKIQFSLLKELLDDKEWSKGDYLAEKGKFCEYMKDIHNMLKDNGQYIKFQEFKKKKAEIFEKIQDLKKQYPDQSSFQG